MWPFSKKEVTADQAMQLVSLDTSRAPNVTRQAEAILSAYESMPWLHSPVNKIARAIAGVDWVAGYTSSKKRSSRPVYRAADGSLELVKDHPILDLLYGGCELVDGAAVMQFVAASLDLKGEAFLMVQTDPKTGLPAGLWPLPVHWVREIPSLSSQKFKVQVRSSSRDFARDDIIWFKDISPRDPYGRCKGIPEAYADELDSDEYAAAFTKSFFLNDATPSGIVSFEGASADEVKAASAQWENKHRGSRKAKRIHFTNKKIEHKQLDGSFKDSEVVELRKFLRDAIRQGFGIPPELMGQVESSNRATIEAATYIFAKWVVVPRLDLICSVLQRQLAPKYPDDVRVSYVSPVPEDKKFRLEAAEANPRTLTINEWRELQSLPPIGGGDRLFGSEGSEQRSIKRKSLITKVDVGDVENILERLRPEVLIDRAKPLFEDKYEVYANISLEEIGTATAFNMRNPLVIEHFEDFALNRLTGMVNQTTKTQMKKVVMQGIRAGEDVERIRRRIETVFSDAESWRARMIARTEVNRSANHARWQAQKFSGVVNAREWIATIDGATRDTHTDMDKQRRGIDQPFTSSSGYTAMAPGNFGVGFEDINCRCTTVGIINNQDITREQMDAIWRSFDSFATGWEDLATERLIEAFLEQESEVLDYYDQLRA